MSTLVTLGSLFPTIDDALNAFLNSVIYPNRWRGSVKNDLPRNSDSYINRWRTVLQRNPEAILAMPAGLVQVVIQNTVIFDAMPADADDYMVPVGAVTLSFDEIVDRVRKFWLREVDDDAFEMLIGLPSDRISAIVHTVDAPGPYHAVDTLTQNQIMMLPIAMLSLIGNMFGMFLDRSLVENAVTALLAEIESGDLTNEQAAVEQRFKTLLEAA